MSDFQLDLQTNDLVIANNNLVIITKTDEIAQRLRQNLRTFKGEWFLNSDIGITFYEDILKKDINPAIVQAVLVDAILDTPGVIRIEDFSLDLTGRMLSVAFKVLATTNDIITDNLELN